MDRWFAWLVDLRALLVALTREHMDQLVRNEPLQQQQPAGTTVVNSQVRGGVSACTQ